ncbi:MAG: ABC transporter substrate-binding protein [Actinomycetota bacterium]|nr:ABC transporter substrate-binding protein [Actinomycetota bacterium]MDH5224625.1 ABC transporter substrate-binding protein [Actinomycetota bacterium]MDH5313018.1 ABC transporter substrate-binding protein [Actinomycetota bacterium]
MRKFLFGLAMLAIVAAACAPEDDTSSAPTDGTTATDTPVDAATCAADASLVNDGMLTIGTGNPAFPPWWEGGTTQAHKEWEFNDPYLGEGFEGATVFAVAEQLGFTPEQIEFVPVPFNKSFAPGPKDFDFVLQQISYSDKREQAVDFSDSYYDVNQALVSVKGSDLEGATTLAELQGAKLGAPLGTTSFDYIDQNIQPTEEPAVYNDLNGAVQALKNGQIDGIVVDLPTAFFITAVQIPKGIIVGQFPTVGAQEYFALALEKGSTLTECLDLAIGALKDDGTLASIQQEWLSDNTSAPVIEG